ncbi:thioredoxin family protein [Actinomadura sp. 7K534]|uniref:TlpA family protein disulfide reductase n=1 Tax=Actinomadura sp. 7K534 TaxID=2530366 RepID=UPI0010457FF8|nr:thioredoxin family protein [Actinomadura sp. 7K534]TDB95636.1 thioredoxin [Actinomadura sp. 7K534]
MTGLWAAATVLVATTVFGLLWRRRSGVLRPRRGSGDEVDDIIRPDDMGAELGEKATLLQFSSAFCAPCRATRRVLGEVAGMVDGVAHVELDAESHLDLVRRLNVVRTPTVFVLDDTGRIIRRATGAPRKPDVIAVLGTAVRRLD